MSFRRGIAVLQLLVIASAMALVLVDDACALDTLLGNPSAFQAPTTKRTTKFLEQFNTPTGSSAATNAAYSPPWSSALGTTTVVGGVLQTTGGGNYTINAAAFTGPIHIAADLTAGGGAV